MVPNPCPLRSLDRRQSVIDAMLEPAPADDWSIEDAAHLLNRAGFGGPPDTLREWHSLGRTAAVARLLKGPEAAGAPALPRWFDPDAYRTRITTQLEERRKLQASGEAEAREEARQLQRRRAMKDRQQATEAAGWWLDRLFTTPAPLVEKMTLFWHGHFATSIAKVKDPYLMLQQNELFRRHALGNVRALTREVVRDPAMMIYLDTHRSTRRHPNENFARELMELFTLGEGRYSEDDVMAAARAFTGLRINRPLGRAFFHRPSWDPGTKEFLGRSGRFQADDIVDILFAEEACAPFLARKIAAFFISDAPSDALVNAIAAEFRRHDFEVAPVLHTVFRSTEFYRPEYRRSRIKSPVQFVVQSRHALELDSLPRALQLGILQLLGQSLFQPPNVAGWDGGRAWITTHTLLARYNIAGYLVKGPASGFRPPLVHHRKAPAANNRDGRERLARQLARRAVADVAALAPPALRQDRHSLLAALELRLFQETLDETARRPFLEYLEQQGDGPPGPETVASLLHLMMSSPRYQLC